MMRPQATIVSTTDAHAAIGPYSQAVVVRGGRTLYSSGQIALDPKTGEMLGNDVRAQAELVMKNLAAVLAAADMGLANVVRATIYLASMDDFATVNEVYGAHFETDPPARACIQAAKLPKGALVEIDVVAVGD